MMSRRKTLPSFNSSRQMMTAWNVSGLSHRPAIIASRPASMRLAMAISPSRDNSSTQPAGFALFLLRLVLLLLVGLGLLGLDDVDAHLVHDGEHVLDLLGGDLLGRHHGIELLIGDVAALLGLLDHLLDGGVGQIEQRQRAVLLRGLGAVLLGGLGVFRQGRFGLGRDGLGGHAALARHASISTGRFMAPYPMVSESPWIEDVTPGPGLSPSVPCCWALGFCQRPKRAVAGRVYPWTPPESRPNVSELR